MSEEIEENKANEIPKMKKIKIRTLIVLASLVIFLIIAFIQCRVEYISALEIGEEYANVVMQNEKYKLYIGVTNFIIVFFMIYITNGLIKKGLRTFFEEDQKEMPKLPNKSLALVGALITSLIVSNMFLQKVILFVNTALFGIPDPIYGMDIGFYIFQAPLIGQLLYYGTTLFILLTVYTVVYYLVCFNKFFDGVNGQTLRKNTFIKQLLFNAMVIIIFIALIMMFNIQNIGTDRFLNLNNELETEMVGAGVSGNIKIWGYRILAVVMIISVYMAIRAFKKDKSKQVIKSLAVVPVYLVLLFVVTLGYDILFVKGNELDKQKSYIKTNIDYTKTAYDIELDGENLVESTGTITR